MSAGEGFNISKVMYDALIGCLVLLELVFIKMLSDLRSTDEKLFDKVNRIDTELAELKGEHRERCKNEEHRQAKHI